MDLSTDFEFPVLQHHLYRSRPMSEVCGFQANFCFEFSSKPQSKIWHTNNNT